MTEGEALAPVPRASGATTPLIGRSAAWLFAPSHFRLKLLLGTGAGIAVIIFLAGVFLFIAIHNHQQDVLRRHTIEIIHLGNVTANNLDAIEASYRGFLLSGSPVQLEEFNRRRDQIKRYIDQLTNIIRDSSPHRKRIVRVQDGVRQWFENIALPAIERKRAAVAQGDNSSGAFESNLLGAPLLAEARSNLQSIQNEEQILLNQKTRDQEWPAQSTQILDFLPKLERSVIEMEKEERGFLLTGDNSFLEGYKHAIADFYTIQGYLSLWVAGTSDQAEYLADMRSRVDRWIQGTAVPEMNARRSGTTLSAVGENSHGEALLGPIRQSISMLERSEMDGFESMSDAAKRNRIIKTTALGILCLFAAGLLVISSSYTIRLWRRQLAKLEGAETRIRAIIDHILDGMIALDDKGVICSMNPAAEKMFGCLRNEMAGHNLVKLIPRFYPNEPESEPVPCTWPEIANRTGSITLAMAQTRNSTSFPVEISLSEMEVDHQTVYIAMVRDVTAQKRFERELAAEKESLAVTLRSIGDGVITTDIQGRIVMINHAGENLTGWSSREAVGQPLKAIFDIAIDLVAQARIRKNGFRNEVHSLLLGLPENSTLKSRDGIERVIEQVASPIRDNKNDIAGVVLVFRDITERQRNEEERRKAETLEQLGLLAGGIAHDFNNLLTAIIGNISLASLLLPPNHEMATRLEDAKNASLRARDLAQQLLTFARGGAPIKKTASIGRLIQDTVNFSLRGSRSRSEFQLGADLWPAEIDPGQISQVIANLAVNADQAMPNGGTLHVHCENFSYDGQTKPQIADLAPGDYIRISVRDEGTGISEHYLKRIFDPYFTTKSHGNGLGLATTYSIIKNHNGVIAVESQLGVGSMFTIYLPALKNLEIPAESSEKVTDSLSGSGRILVVDDEEAIRTLVEFTLSHLGYEVTQAGSAQQGVDIYRERFEAGQRFDLVILDLTLPGGMGGEEALKKLMEIDPNVNSIVSSGYATDATMSRYQDFGFRGVIAKPYEAEELGRIVQQVINSPPRPVESKPAYQMQRAC